MTFDAEQVERWEFRSIKFPTTKWIAASDFDAAVEEIERLRQVENRRIDQLADYHNRAHRLRRAIEDLARRYVDMEIMYEDEREGFGGHTPEPDREQRARVVARAILEDE